jgi:predicted negative regulator of RcsB-dependent stress response
MMQTYRRSSREVTSKFWADHPKILLVTWVVLAGLLVAGWRQIQINQQKKEATTDTVSYRYSI